MSHQKKPKTPDPKAGPGKEVTRNPLLQHPLKPGDAPSEDSGPAFGQSVEQGGVD